MNGLSNKVTAVSVAAVMLFSSGITFAGATGPAVETRPAVESAPAVEFAPAVESGPAVESARFVIPEEAGPTVEASNGLAKAPDVIRREMKVSGYQLVKVNGKFKVYLKQGNEQKIVVEGDEDLVPEVKHFIVDNTLNIYTSDQVKKRITLWVTLKDINNLNKYGNVRVIRDR